MSAERIQVGRSLLGGESVAEEAIEVVGILSFSDVLRCLLEDR